MEPTDPWVLILVALATATIASSVGLGGGLLIVPYLVGVAGFPHRVADATSLVVVGVSALVATAGYARQKRVDAAAAGCFAVSMMPGAAPIPSWTAPSRPPCPILLQFPGLPGFVWVAGTRRGAKGMVSRDKLTSYARCPRALGNTH